MNVNDTNSSKWAQFNKEYGSYVFLIGRGVNKHKELLSTVGEALDCVAIVHSSFEYGIILIPEIGHHMRLSDVANDFYNNDIATYKIDAIDKVGNRFRIEIPLSHIVKIIDFAKKRFLEEAA